MITIWWWKEIFIIFFWKNAKEFKESLIRKKYKKISTQSIYPIHLKDSTSQKMQKKLDLI